ncbi:MAG TPA: SOS response-associated peptidase [Anaerolineaceae bacterium]|nr:SOS response-associated peptidase [Anaerolineaceae bacterium]
MCGRFTLTYKTKELQLLLGLPETNLEWQPRYNIAPSQPIAAILENKTKSIEFLHWGLVPSWAKDITIGNRLINARSETIMEKPSFKNAFKRRRCLILADGFYEWKKSSSKGGSSIPYYFYLNEKQPFALAGIWEIWQSPDGSEIWSTAIITCDANEIVKPVHERMPVVLDKDEMFDWLDDRPEPELVNMMSPYPTDKMKSHQVGKAVNSPFNDVPECIQEKNQNN